MSEHHPPGAAPALPNLHNLNIFLVGMMGCGKTTIGHRLATALGYQFVDTDGVIVQLTQQSVSEIFSTQGEPHFRELETRVLSELTAHTRLVIGTGGGIILQRHNWGHLRQGLVIWLDVSLEDLWQRLRHDRTRPLLRKRDPYRELQTLLRDRQALYSQADLHIQPQANSSPEQVVTQILTALPTVIRSENTGKREPLPNEQ
jgi:shikimate kinase